MFSGKSAAQWTAAAIMICAVAQGILPSRAQAPAAPGAAKPATGAPGAPAAPTPVPVDLNLLVGTWTTALDGLPFGPAMGSLKVDKSGDKFVGTLSSALGEMKADSIKASGPNAVLTASLDLMGQASEVELSVKPDKDKFTGTFSGANGMVSGGFRGAKAGSEAEKTLKTEVEAKIKEIQGEPTLPVADAKQLMGEWTLTGDSPMGPIPVDIELADVGGKVSAKIKLPQPFGPVTMNHAEKTAKGIALKQKMELMGNESEMAIELDREGPMISGMLDVGSGMFSVPLEGLRKGRAVTKVSVAGKNVMIEYGRPSTSGAGYKQLATVKDDYIWRMGRNEATNLKADADLKFGDKTVKAGRYSLWAKKTPAGWNLVFNSEPDVWGTNHKSTADVAEIPLTSSKPAAPAELLTLDLKADSATPNGVVFRLAWGDQEGTGKFTVDVPPPAAAAPGATSAAPGAAPKPAAK